MKIYWKKVKKLSTKKLHWYIFTSNLFIYLNYSLLLLIFHFEFNLNEEEQFKKYYSNLSIDENKINKYIKGIKNKINIKEIKEKMMLIFVILFLNINDILLNL